MRVLYLHQYFNTPEMSGGTRSYEMARRLIASGHQVTVITADRSTLRRGRDWYVSDEAGIQVHWLPVPYSNHMSFPERICAFVCFAFESSLRASSIPGDIVFATSTPLTIAIPGIVTEIWQRIPLVFEVRDLWPDLPIAVGALRNPLFRNMARLLEWVAYRASAHIIALSPGMAEGVMRRGISASRVTVIPNCSDVALFDIPAGRGDWIRDQLGLAPHQPLIVYAGTFGRINGVGYLVSVAEAMRTIRPDVRFLLVGTGAELGAVTEQARDRGVLNRNLWVWRPIQKIRVPELLAAATLATSVVIPVAALWNNSANKFFDALAAGKPIAINYRGWQAELLEESGAGIALSPDDVGESAKALAEFVSDADRLRSASAASRRLAYEVFNREVLYTQLEAVLRSVRPAS
jgi:glycosyltransferase involved in cell wall biosynthesis